jgi:hypothetical protein
MRKHVPDASAAVEIRQATSEDEPALRRLSILDSQPFLYGPSLVAVVGDEIWAAVSLESTASIADPFRPSAELVLLLAERARQIVAAEAPDGFARRARRRLTRLLNASAAERTAPGSG